MTTAKTSQALYDHLFAAIAGVREGTVTIEQAKAIGDLSQVVVNVAKVENDYLRVKGSGKSRFINAIEDEPKPALPTGILGVRRHLIGDD